MTDEKKNNDAKEIAENRWEPRELILFEKKKISCWDKANKITESRWRGIAEHARTHARAHSHSNDWPKLRNSDPMTSDSKKDKYTHANASSKRTTVRVPSDNDFPPPYPEMEVSMLHNAAWPIPERKKQAQ